MQKEFRAVATVPTDPPLTVAQVNDTLRRLSNDAVIQMASDRAPDGKPWLVREVCATTYAEADGRTTKIGVCAYATDDAAEALTLQPVATPERFLNLAALPAPADAATPDNDANGGHGLNVRQWHAYGDSMAQLAVNRGYDDQDRRAFVFFEADSAVAVNGAPCETATDLCRQLDASDSNIFVRLNPRAERFGASTAAEFYFHVDPVPTHSE